MRRSVMLALSCAFCANAAFAQSDEESTPDDSAPTLVRARLDGTMARLTARFAFSVTRGASPDVRAIELPGGATVVGATVTVNGHSRRLDLTDAKTASDKFDAIRAGATTRNTAWAVALRTEQPALLAVDAAAPRDAKMTLDLELDAPTCFVEGARHVRFPDTWSAVLEPALRSSHVADADVIGTACGTVDGEGSWTALPTPVNHAPTPEGRISTPTARLALSTHDIARLEIDVARELAQIPDDLRTAIVVDASRSLTAAEIDHQRAIVAAYLAVAPRGSVQLISYARRATPLLSRWTTAKEAAPAIDRALRSLTLRNGSNIDAGLAVAATWLAKTSGTKRVLVLSDELLAKRVSDHVAALAQAVPPGTIVHTIALDDYSTELARDDSAKLAPLAAATTGISVDGGVDEQGHVNATILARPVALDHVTLKTPQWEPLESVTSTCEDDSSLAEGMSCSWWGLGGAASGDVTVNGLIWNKPFKRVLHPDPSQAIMLARTLSGLGGFAEAMQHDIDEAALAVNSVWSLFGAWGGTGGYDDREMGGGTGWGSICGCDRIGTIGHGSGTGTGLPKETSELRDQLAAAVKACHPDGARVEVTVETTIQEIADVNVAVSPSSAAIKDCVVEGVWNVQLHLRDAKPYRQTTLAYVY